MDSKQKLVDAYRHLLPTFNVTYLPKFYRDFALFPARSRELASLALQQIGARNLYDGFLDNKVEILINAPARDRLSAQLGHVSINIGGVIYSRAPTVWDIRSKENYLGTQQGMRNTIGYVMQLDEAGKCRLFQSVLSHIVQDKQYNVLDHRCTQEIISAFADLNIDIVDPRTPITEVFSPTNMDNFLKHAQQVIQTNFYPKQ